MTMQRTTEWHQARLGKPTGSRFGDIKPGRGTKWSQTTISYMYELLAERLTGQWQEAYGSAIEWGLQYEDDARELYTKSTQMQIEQVGFFEQDGMGCSPDGMIGLHVTVEIKCPYNSRNHIDYKLNGPGDHMAQIQAEIYFTGAQSCEFISYDPRMPEELQLVVIHVDRDDAYIADMIARVKEFIADLDEMERRVRA